MIFKFNFKPLTFNQAYQAITRGRRAAIIKTSAYREYEKKVRSMRPSWWVEEIESMYDPSKHGIVIEMKIFLKGMVTKPKKKGELPRISKTALDLTNPAKATIDAMLGDTKVNDAYIVDYRETKVNSAQDRFELSVKVVSFDTNEMFH